MPVPVSLSEAKAAVRGVSAAYHYPRGGNLDYENHLHNAMLELMKAYDFLVQLEREQREQQHPSMLELRGAINLLDSALEKLHFSESGPNVDKGSYFIISAAKTKVWEEYNELLHPVKRCPCCHQPLPKEP